jgi:hypothetical protein
MDFAERLSLWLHAFDAIGLQSALQSVRAIDTAAVPSPAARPARGADLAEDLRRVRSVLARAIAQSDPADGPWQQRHLELQRQMEQMVGALRDHVRQALSRASPRLRQLAALDAALDGVFGVREQALLPRVPVLLKQRLQQRQRAEAASAESAPLRPEEGAAQSPEQPPPLPPPATAASDSFTDEWRQVLLAELELRLEPVTGLIEALSNEARNP